MPMKPGPARRVRGVYGKPWSKLVGKDIPVGPEVLEEVGRILVESIVEEARKAIAKQAPAPRRGQPYEIPDSEDFLRSFKHRVVGASTVEVMSTHPLIDQVLEGRDPYPMTWLTRERGVYIVPLVGPGGRVLFRMAPLKTKDAWIHPGFARHTFVQRGIKKGRERAARLLAQSAVQALLKGDPFK